MDLPEKTWILVLVPAGMAEGAAIGFAQAHVLDSRIEGFAPRRWLLATVAGAGIAWTLGMAPNAVYDAVKGIPAAVLLVPVVLDGAALLLSQPTLQWLVLREHVARPGWWIPANILAWAAGISFVFAGMALVSEGDPGPCRRGSARLRSRDGCDGRRGDGRGGSMADTRRR